jgi:hypothetical protein
MDRIRLKLFTDAGFTLIPGQGNSASKVLIRKSLTYSLPLRLYRMIIVFYTWDATLTLIGDEAKSDIHTLSLDNARSKTHNANFIWGLAGE